MLDTLVLSKEKKKGKKIAWYGHLVFGQASIRPSWDICLSLDEFGKERTDREHVEVLEIIMGEGREHNDSLGQHLDSLAKKKISLICPLHFSQIIHIIGTIKGVKRGYNLLKGWHKKTRETGDIISCTVSQIIPYVSAKQQRCKEPCMIEEEISWRSSKEHLVLTPSATVQQGTKRIEMHEWKRPKTKEQDGAMSLVRKKSLPTLSLGQLIIGWIFFTLLSLF